MKQMSEDKRVRLTELEKLTYEVEIGNTRKILKVKGTNLNRVENKAFEDVLKNILIGYIQSKRCHLPFNEAFACRRLSLKTWPREYIDGFIPDNFHVKREYLDEIVRMVSIHVTANFLSQPHKEAA